MTQEPEQGFVFRDRRRVDPETGEVRTPPPADTPGAAGAAQEPADATGPSAGAGVPAGDPGAAAAAEAAFADDETEKLRTELAERTADLQRVQAEYVNYRRRVDRDRETLRQLTIGKVLTQLLPVLDDIDRARTHGELEGGFKAVAEALEKAAAEFGLERYGEEGDPFNPTVHEAMTHEYSADVDGIVCSRIYQPGYRVGTRVLRAARVAVTEAEGGATPASVEGALKLDEEEAQEAGATAEPEADRG
ncbi:MAG: nucleotide exchange factor GrpE [Streptosporangiales bacterium]